MIPRPSSRIGVFTIVLLTHVAIGPLVGYFTIFPVILLFDHLLMGGRVPVGSTLADALRILPYGLVPAYVLGGGPAALVGIFAGAVQAPGAPPVHPGAGYLRHRHGGRVGAGAQAPRELARPVRILGGHLPDCGAGLPVSDAPGRVSGGFASGREQKCFRMSRNCSKPMA